MFLTDMSIDLIRGAGQVTFTYLGPGLDMFPTRDYSPAWRFRRVCRVADWKAAE